MQINEYFFKKRKRTERSQNKVPKYPVFRFARQELISAFTYTLYSNNMNYNNLLTFSQFTISQNFSTNFGLALR